MSLLRINDLNISYPGSEPVIEGLNFSIEKGEAVGLVGESGSGKTQTALSIMGLLPDNARASGEVVFDGENILGLPACALNRYRTKRMSIVFQDPMFMRLVRSTGSIWHALCAARQSALNIANSSMRQN